MPLSVALPNLATHAPLWLALFTVGTNAFVGALRGYGDETFRWDIIGLSAFALMMGPGGGFIRDLLLVARIFLASELHPVLAVFGSALLAVLWPWNQSIGAIVGIAGVILAQAFSRHLNLRTRATPGRPPP